VSIAAGIHVTLWLGAICYAVLIAPATTLGLGARGRAPSGS